MAFENYVKNWYKKNTKIEIGKVYGLLIETSQTSMGNLGLGPSKNQVVPVKIQELAKNNIYNRLHALRLILNNEPFVYSFRRFLEDEVKDKLIFVTVYAELDSTQAKIEIMDHTSMLTDIEALIFESKIILALFHAAPGKHQATAPNEEAVKEYLRPLLASQDTDIPKTMFLHDLQQLINDCQTKLLMHLLSELYSYTNSEYFGEYKHSNVLLYQSIIQQIELHSSTADEADEFFDERALYPVGGRSSSSRKYSVDSSSSYNSSWKSVGVRSSYSSFSARSQNLLDAF